MYHFCTITTADHMYKTLALYESLRAIRPDTYLHVLCIDALPGMPVVDQAAFYTTADMAALPPASAILSKYRSSKDKIRWSMKPVFLRYLLENKAETVIYTDNDIYFYDDYIFLFDLLREHTFLLTPHHYPHDPNQEQNWLEANYKVGLYNAGFAGVSTAAISTLQWWAECCAYRCEKNVLRGTFDDQKYLDLVPVMDEKAHIVRHKGCNVAEWNRRVISRSEKEGKVMLDEIYPLVFIQFNGTTVRAIAEGREPCLKKSFDLYLQNLKKYKPDLKPESLYNKETNLDRMKYHIWRLATDWGF
jgi:hypothetical protein